MDLASPASVATDASPDPSLTLPHHVLAKTANTRKLPPQTCQPLSRLHDIITYLAESLSNLGLLEVESIYKLAAESMGISHLNVKTAFLNGDLTEPVHMVIPEGFKQHGTRKLLKSIYGL